jgi:hypothetical protein
MPKGYLASAIGDNPDAFPCGPPRDVYTRAARDKTAFAQCFP